MLPIIIAPDPRLKRRAEAVEKVDAETRRLMDDLFEPMHAANGIGLAAPQVGENIRLILVRLNIKSKTENLAVMVNPEIVHRSKEEVMTEEGCLSLPSICVKVFRAKEIIVSFETMKREKMSLKLSGLNARIIQHEIDHLNGVLIADYGPAVIPNLSS